MGFLLEGDHTGEEEVKSYSGSQTRYLYRLEPFSVLGFEPTNETMGKFKKALSAKDKRSWHQLTPDQFEQACNVHLKKLPATL